MHPAVSDSLRVVHHTFVSGFLGGQSRKQNPTNYIVLGEKSLTSGHGSASRPLKSARLLLPSSKGSVSVEGCTSDRSRGLRGPHPPSPWREECIRESVSKLFQTPRTGLSRGPV